MQWYQILSVLGVPSFLFGILTTLILRKINKSDKKREKMDKDLEERAKRQENFLLAILSSQRATNTLSRATARAVQRIPDAHCNGDMHAALEEAERCQMKENEFLMTLGIQALNK